MSRSPGFTMLELLVVMAILAILVGAGAKGYSLARRQAKEGRALAMLEKLRVALDEFRVEFDAYPGTGHDGPVGELPEIGTLTNGVDGLELTDPWGRPYLYRHEAGNRNRYLYQLWSEGQDPESDQDNVSPFHQE